MNDLPRPRGLGERLVRLGEEIAPAELFPVEVPEARTLLSQSTYAFCIAGCLDRGMEASVVWTIPYDLRNELGHLDPFRIREMSEVQLAGVFQRLPRRPRYVNDAPRTIRGLTAIVVDENRGEASGIWKNRPAAEVYRTFRRVHGVGDGIANMMVLLIEKAYAVRFNDLDRRSMDIKPDIHTMRVLFRTGAANTETTEHAKAAARRLWPEYPGAIDGSLWRIGQQWCRTKHPDCGHCPLDDLCPKVGVGAVN